VNTETTRYRDELVVQALKQSHKPGAIVRVLPSYRGNGKFAPDGAEGYYVVLSQMKSGTDYKIARVPCSATGALFLPKGYHESADWDYMMHASRLQPLSYEVCVTGTINILDERCAPMDRPVDPAVMSHYLAACTVAKLSPADISAKFRSAVEARELFAEVAKRSIPDAVAYLRRRITEGSKQP
jgi:hypothetical protein